MSLYVRGATLIESLAALLVMAVGFVGVAALYLDAEQSAPESMLRREAITLADAMAERIRQNEEGRTGYASSIGVVCGKASARRSLQKEAARETACWKADVERRLPSGLGSVTRDLSTTPVTYVVAVSWSSPESGASSYVVRLE